MSENPKSHSGSLPPNFDLNDELKLAQAKVNEFELPVAAEAAQRLFNMNNQDPKTGLLHQEAWMKGLDQTIKERRDDQAVVVRVLDLDGFKSVNDRLGHTAGDKLLGIAGQAVSLSFQRQSDTKSRGSRENNSGVARLGGDEYAEYEVIDTDPSDSTRVVHNALDNETQSERVNENFQKLLASTEFADFDLRLSMGTAALEPSQTAEDVFAVADYNMFVAKYTKKIDPMTEEDKKQLRDHTLPHLRRIGARVEPWLEEAANQVT